MNFGLSISEEHWEIIDDVYNIGSHKLKGLDPWLNIDSSIDIYKLVRTDLSSRDIQDKLMNNMINDHRRLR